MNNKLLLDYNNDESKLDVILCLTSKHQADPIFVVVVSNFFFLVFALTSLRFFVDVITQCIKRQYSLSNEVVEKVKNVYIFFLFII